MKVVAILEVDEKKLSETGHSFKDEMGRVAQSGIELKEYREVGKECEYEYAAFVWNNTLEKYVQNGRPVMSLNLCKDRFIERVTRGWIEESFDTSKVIFKRRLTAEISEGWEEFKEG